MSTTLAQPTEHPFPAAVEDAVRAYQWMLGRGWPRVIVAGDSSGCRLTLESTFT